MSSKASNVVAPVAVAPKPEYYLMDLNVGNISALQELAPDPSDVDDEPQSQESGVIGIKIKPLKVKQYTNSVCYTN